MKKRSVLAQEAVLESRFMDAADPRVSLVGALSLAFRRQS